MAVKIRLMRMGAKKAPFYRVVVADSRSPRDGRFLENLGIYHPNNEPSRVEIDTDKAAAWLAKGDTGYAWMDKDLPQQVKEDIFTAVSVAQGKVAPRLVSLPFAAPAARSADETSKGGAR